MRVLVTGAGGMLARALLAELRRRDHEVVALDRAALDVTDEGAVEARIQAESPEVVVQCAAFTAVDAAEAEEPAAMRVNADATRYVARACQRVGALLVYPSTDYVFSGSGDRPYRPSDPPAPVNAYGRTKLAGERAALEAAEALVVRTSWLYGAGGPNFIDTISRLARERDRLEVVDDQVGRPTWTVSLAVTLTDLLEQRVAGTFHATDGGEPVSWFGVARRILAERSLATPIRPVGSAAFPRPARRPAYSVLDCLATEETIGRLLPDWGEMLARYLRSGDAGE
ncbi:MAG TPA: dTDP-4-dehydrorhamnose reductase [Longimicrobiaceae bacterium]|nr:dTDP-4-dehydrorhamnose reductase [Longimicrobiaceae bacterium]